MIVLLCTIVGCDRNSSDAPGETSYELPEHYEPVAGMRFRQMEGQLVTNCIVRGDRAFAGCEDCPVACSQFKLRRENGPIAGRVPEGLHHDYGPDDDVVVSAKPLRITVDGRPAVDMRRGEVDPRHLGGDGSYRIDPVLERILEHHEQLRERGGRGGDEPGEPGATLYMEPAHRARLLFVLISTIMDAGPHQLKLAVAGHDIREFELACRRGGRNRHLFETDDDGEPLEFEPRGGAEQVSWYCRDVSDVLSGKVCKRSRALKRTTVALKRPRTVPLANRFLPAQDLMDDEPETASLKITIRTDGVSVANVERNHQGMMIASEREDFIAPIEGCPGDGPTVCLLEGKGDAGDLFESAREELFEVARQDAARGLYTPPLKEAIDRYDFEALSRLLTNWHQDTEEPSDVATVSVQDDIPAALVIQTFDLLRGKGQWEGERQFFEDVELSIGDRTHHVRPNITIDGPDDYGALFADSPGSGSGTGALAALGDRSKAGDIEDTDVEETDTAGDLDSDVALDREVPDSTVVPRDPTAEGALDRELIYRVVRQHRGDIQTCYEVELNRDRSLEGRITMQWVISGTGDVVHVTVQDSTMNNTAVERCLKGRIQQWSFPETDGGDVVRVNYPFEFSAR